MATEIFVTVVKIAQAKPKKHTNWAFVKQILKNV